MNRSSFRVDRGGAKAISGIALMLNALSRLASEDKPDQFKVLWISLMMKLVYAYYV